MTGVRGGERLMTLTFPSTSAGPDSRASFHTTEILYIFLRNCYTSQGDPDSSFPYLWSIAKLHAQFSHWTVNLSSNSLVERQLPKRGILSHPLCSFISQGYSPNTVKDENFEVLYLKNCLKFRQGPGKTWHNLYPTYYCTNNQLLLTIWKDHNKCLTLYHECLLAGVVEEVRLASIETLLCVSKLLATKWVLRARVKLLYQFLMGRL